jgi:hypothetical protein
MALHVFGGNAQIAAADIGRHPVGGMVAGDKPAAGAVFAYDVIWGHKFGTSRPVIAKASGKGNLPRTLCGSQAVCLRLGHSVITSSPNFHQGGIG